MTPAETFHALAQAEELFDGGWDYYDDAPRIFHPGIPRSSQDVDPLVWAMMVGIEAGVRKMIRADPKPEAGQTPHSIPGSASR